ncbi:MAG: hypothetical protein EXQ71_00845 [Acidimicrobiia bacterium]|nr:hypothetical protein [Acidimicrobiia bacterium]
MTPCRWFSGLAIALLVGAVGIAPAVRAQTAMPQQPAMRAVSMARSASSSLDAEFLSRINSLRASKGLSQLHLSGELGGVARNRTDQRAAAHAISHNPNLSGQVSGAWTMLGENVGSSGPTNSVDVLMPAFHETLDHDANRPEATRPPGAGDTPLRMAVPATVVVRIDRRGAVTAAMSNTGRPPEPGDDLWVARTGHPDIEPAPPALVRAVMAQTWPGHWPEPGIWNRAATDPAENP